MAEPGTTGLQPESWTPDGKTLVLSVSTGDPRRLARLDVGPDSKPSPLVEEWASNASLSPDGRWLAYHGRNQGRVEVYVQAFPPTDSKYQISTEGGRDPVWSPDGKELFYLQSGRTGMQVVTVDVQTQATFAALRTTPLPIEGIISVGARAYDVWHPAAKKPPRRSR